MSFAQPPPAPRIPDLGREAAVEHYHRVQGRALQLMEALAVDPGAIVEDILLAQHAYVAAQGALARMDRGTL